MRAERDGIARVALELYCRGSTEMKQHFRCCAHLPAGSRQAQPARRHSSHNMLRAERADLDEHKDLVGNRGDLLQGKADLVALADLEQRLRAIKAMRS